MDQAPRHGIPARAHIPTENMKKRHVWDQIRKFVAARMIFWAQERECFIPMPFIETIYCPSLNLEH